MQIENQFPQNSKETAIIDFTIDSRDFAEQNAIHKSEFNDVKKLIRSQIPAPQKKQSVKEQDLDGVYKTILVEGGRGTGKTTTWI